MLSKQGGEFIRRPILRSIGVVTLQEATKKLMYGHLGKYLDLYKGLDGKEYFWAVYWLVKGVSL